MKNALILGSLILFLISCATADENLKKEGLSPLSQTELETLFEDGLTISFKGKNASGTVTHHADGNCEIKWGSEPDETDTGTYNLKDGMFCSKWTEIRNGEEQCVKFYKMGNNKYKSFKLDGTLNSEFSIIQ